MDFFVSFLPVGNLSMIEAKDRLKSLKVTDAMAPHLVTISAHSTMGEAADILCEHQITGAPVVDERKQCVGVISSSDFVHCKAEELEMSHVHSAASTDHFSRSRSEASHDLVRHHMTPTVKTVVDDSFLLEAARRMCREHIHRLIVVNCEDKPIGILTSLDLLATLIGVVEE
jgi:predicted transcriptional regulator